MLDVKILVGSNKKSFYLCLGMGDCFSIQHVPYPHGHAGKKNLPPQKWAFDCLSCNDTTKACFPRKKIVK